MANNKFYAVKIGKNPGVYQTWDQCNEQVKGYTGAKYKSFTNLTDAENYINDECINEQEVSKNNSSIEDINTDIEEKINNLSDDEIIAFVDGSYNKEAEKVGFGVIIIGKGREISSYYNSFDGKKDKDLIPLRNVVGELKPDLYRIPGNISSQFITGLLFALPLLSFDSIIEITTPLESKGYIDLTLQVLKLYGIEIVNHEYKQFIVRGRQEYKARDYRVESDFSQAAFYLVAGALGNDVTLLDLNLDSLQGDKATIDFLKQMNCEIVENDEGIKVVSHGLKATIVDASQCPDVIPVVSLALAVASGHSEVINAGRLRIKECDRLQATVEELNKLKAHAVEHESSMELDGVETLTGGNVSSHDDHRMAMMLAIASTVCKEPVIIDNKECVKKSYPSFWEDFEMLGGKIDGCNL